MRLLSEVVKKEYLYGSESEKSEHINEMMSAGYRYAGSDMPNKAMYIKAIDCASEGYAEALCKEVEKSMTKDLILKTTVVLLCAGIASVTLCYDKIKDAMMKGAIDL